MNRYENPMPRALIAAAAVVMSALTLAVAVALPAHFAGERHVAGVIAASRGAALRDVAVIPVRIEVVGQAV